MATCSVGTLIQQACDNNFKCLDEQQFRGLVLQLLCNLSASSSDGLPSGAIILWSGTIASIPSGYALCNGSNGTPDLRNRFVVCANADSGGQARTTLTGPATQSGGSITHTHAITDPGHTHSTPNGLISVDNSAALVDVVEVINDPTTSSTTGITINNASAPQPYFALAYIMKL